MFPHFVCPICERETPDGKLCENCLKLKIQPNFCEICGEHVSAESRICLECKEMNRIFDWHGSVLLYGEAVSRSVQKLKFAGAKYLAKDFAKLLAEKFVADNIDVDLVTFVPSTAKRIKQRGYNQAEEIAKNFCKIVNLPCVAVLDKIKDTAEQKELSRKDRLKNLIDSFAVKDAALVKGKNVLVIDDVFTTGSTMTACAKAMKKAKANKIYCLTVAKTKNIR